MTFRDKVINFMVKNDLNQTQTAIALGVHRITIDSWLRKGVLPRKFDQMRYEQRMKDYTKGEI